MDAVIWRAVSSEAQAGDDKISLDHQEALARQHAARHSLRVLEVITSDDSRSIVRIDKAMQNPRLGYARLVELIEARAFDVLIFYDTSRLGRNRGLLGTLQEMCYAARIILYDCANPPHDLSTDVGDSQRIMDSLQAVNAQNELARQNKRLQFGRDGRAKRGQFVAIIPYGYQAAGDHIDADPLQAPIVRRIFAAYLDGHGLPYIAARLNDDSIPAPRGSAWQVGTVAYILNNAPRYAGWLEHNRITRNRHERPYIRVRGQWPPLIDEATMERVQSERRARASHRRLADTPHLLSGVTWCIDCSRPMRLNSSKALTYLRCQTHPAGHHAIRADVVMAYIRHEMARLTTADIERMADTTGATTRAQEAIAATRRTLERLTRSLQDADDDRYIHGTLDAERHARAVTRLRTEIANQEAEIARLSDVLRREADGSNRRARLADVLANGPAILQDADPTRANAWLRSHLRVWVQSGKVVLAEWL